MIKWLLLLLPAYVWGYPVQNYHFEQSKCFKMYEESYKTKNDVATRENNPIRFDFFEGPIMRFALIDPSIGEDVTKVIKPIREKYSAQELSNIKIQEYIRTAFINGSLCPVKRGKVRLMNIEETGKLIIKMHKTALKEGANVRDPAVYDLEETEKEDKGGWLRRIFGGGSKQE
jgi:hypothetical protein